jgi:hypothetical protein
MPHTLPNQNQPAPLGGGFNFTAAMERVCREVISRTPELAHVDLDYIAVSFSQTRNASLYGMFASLTPLRFEGGKTTTIRRGRPYSVQQFRAAGGRELLYILTFYMPRFCDLNLREKLITVFHELWHISPRFDGDIRRHEGRCYAHTSSQAGFDQAMGVLADRWLALGPPEETWGFLKHGFADLHRLHGGIHGLRLPRPKLIPVAASVAAPQPAR